MIQEKQIKQDISQIRRNWLFLLFIILYVFYGSGLFVLTSASLGSGIRIPDIDTGFLVSAFSFYMPLALLYLFALLLLIILYFAKTDAKRLAVIGVILPIVALHIARAFITAYHPVTIYP